MIIQYLSQNRIKDTIIRLEAIATALSMLVSGLFHILLKGHKSIMAGIFKLFHKVFFIMARAILKILYRVEVNGLEHYKNEIKPKLVIANHQSYLDAALIACFISEELSFAINTHIAKENWVKPFLNLINTFKIDPLKPFSTKNLIKHIKDGNNVVIFPEGRLTMTGSLMKIYNGPAMIADKSKAKLVPVILDGPQRSIFSCLKGVNKLQLFPKITIDLFPSQELELDKEFKGRERREILGNKLYEVMNEKNFASIDLNKTLFEELLNKATEHGLNKQILIDANRNKLDYKTMIQKIDRFACLLDCSQKSIGIFLPNSISTIISFFAIQANAQTAVMLNFSMSPSNLKACAELAKLKSVISSKEFIKQAKLELHIEYLESLGIQFIYLEDLTYLNLSEKITLAIKPRLIKKASCNDTAVVLFTSGSEGLPKGVALSHKNLLANYNQLTVCFDYNSQDVLLNSLPLFHSFGLTAGMLLPLFSGIKVLSYPSPLHYRVIPELAYQNDVTMIFGTDTFLRNYAKAAHPYDFYKLRFAIAGAEKLKLETKELWMNKFGVRILEAYGATETAPGLTVNTPLFSKSGTVGKFLPGIEYKLETVAGITKGKKLFVKGPNLMKGYLLQGSEALQALDDGWYDTGDIVDIDSEGFVSILGRVKRFAKIAGEMISLSSVEDAIARIEPKAIHAVTTEPDLKKGEKLILCTNSNKLDKETILKESKNQGLSELATPRKIVYLDSIPLLGSGKTDYQKLKLILEAQNENS